MPRTTTSKRTADHAEMTSLYTESHLKYVSLEKMLMALENLGGAQVKACFLYKDEQRRDGYREDANRLKQYILKRFGEYDHPAKEEEETDDDGEDE